MHPLGGHGPLTRALFGENVCENERIGSHRGWHVLVRRLLDPPMNRYMLLMFTFRLPTPGIAPDIALHFQL